MKMVENMQADSISETALPAYNAQKLILEPTKGWVSLQLKDLWVYRELLYFLIWRDIKVRYKQTALGAAWAIIQPVTTMVVFTIFFGKLGKIPSDGIPYPLFAYAALLPWNFFSQAMTESSNSLVGSSNLIRKVYFPRLVIPLSGVLAGLVDFAIAFGVLVCDAFLLQDSLNPQCLFVAIVSFACCGYSAWSRALVVGNERKIS